MKIRDFGTEEVAEIIHSARTHGAMDEGIRWTMEELVKMAVESMPLGIELLSPTTIGELAAIAVKAYGKGLMDAGAQVYKHTVFIDNFGEYKLEEIEEKCTRV